MTDTTPAPTGRSRRVTIEFGSKAYEGLKKLEEKDGLNLTTLTNQAVTLYLFLREQIPPGTVLTLTSSGKAFEGRIVRPGGQSELLHFSLEVAKDEQS